MFIEIDRNQAKSPLALFFTPGSTLFCALATTGKVRGMFAARDGNIYAVCDTTFWEISPAGVKTSRGTVAGTGKVWMDENGYGFSEIMISNNSSTAYIYNYSTNVFGAITDSDFPGATTVSFMDGYFITTKPGTGQVWISDLYAGTSWDATKFKTAEAAPDNAVGAAVANRVLYIFGTDTTEIWANQGIADYPFARQSGAVFQTGCIALESIAVLDTKVFWLSDDLTVKMTDGYNSETISTQAINWAIENYNQVSNAIGFTYKLGGHEYYAITFPGDDITWAYDVTTTFWHRFKSYGQGRSRINCAVQLGQDVYVGDWSSGDISQLDYSALTENGQPIERVRQTQVITEEARTYTMNRLVLDFDTGLSLIEEGLGSNPVISMSYSDDGGRTWSREQDRSIGATGEWNKRVIWTRLGTFRDRILRFRMSDPVAGAIIGAYADLQPGVW